ncbi:MAG: hypothetical protein K6A30_08360 [Lachnospiraceae bacterium]|nr:hypothetical protein [Lachnospiraceae bacterium]
MNLRRKSISIYSIYTKILLIVLFGVIAFSVLNTAFIIPKAKTTVKTVNEHNLQDLATMGAEVLGQVVEKNSEDEITYDLLKPIYDGKGLQGIESSYLYVCNEKGEFLYHKKEDKIGTVVTNEKINKLLSQIPSGSYAANGIYHYDDENGVKKYCAYQVLDSKGWVVVSVADETELLGEINSIRTVGVIVSAIVGAVFLLVGFLSARGIAGSIGVITAVIESVSQLDFTNNEALEVIEHKKDETGIMARAVAQMEESLRDIVDRISKTSMDLDKHAATLKDITMEIDSANADNSASSEELAASMQETSATTDLISERTSHIKANADDIAKEARIGAANAKETKDRAVGIYEETVTSKEQTEEICREINLQGQDALEKSKAVEKVSKLAEAIQGISSQTNLLALNAAIEAARAGDAGRGFSVVADEIGELAKQSGDTVSQIMDIVVEVQTAVDSMSECMTRTLDYIGNDITEDYENFLKTAQEYREDAEKFYDSMAEISGMIERLDEATAEISTSVEAISSNVGDAAMAVTNVAEKATDVASLSAGVVNVVGETRENSDELRELKDSFKI